MRYCKQCNTLLTHKQKSFCSSSCGAIHRNANRPKWSIDINQETHEILEGIMLSDGNLELQKTANFPRFTIGQKWDKIEYIQYICDLLKLSRDRIKFKKSKNKKTGKTYHSVNLSTTTSPIWEQYYKRWYPNGKKIIPSDFVITPLTILHAYIGDGSYSSYKSNKQYGGQIYYRIALYLEDFTEENLRTVLLSQLENIGIPFNFTWHYQNNRKYPKPNINKKELLNRFFNYIPQCPVECYSYKWPY